MDQINETLVHGSIGGVPIDVDVSSFDAFATTKRVLLSAAYVRVYPGLGVPSAPSFTGTNVLQTGVFARGTVLVLHKGEADALIASHKAVEV